MADWDALVGRSIDRSGHATWMTIAIVMSRAKSTPGKIPDIRFYQTQAQAILTRMVDAGALVAGAESPKGETWYVRPPVST